MQDKKPKKCISEGAKFFMNMFLRRAEHRWYCYGLFNSEMINIILLWSILPIGLIAYWMMYYFLPKDAVYQQWDVNFISESIQFFFMGLMVFSMYRHTRHAGMGTSVLVYFIFHLVNSIKGSYMKIWWGSLTFQLILLGLAFFTLFTYIRGAKKSKDEQRINK